MNKLSFAWKLISLSLVRRTARIAVALLAVTIGSAILSGLITINVEVPNQMAQEFRSYGANLILLPSDDQATFTQTSVSAAAQKIPKEATVGIAPYRYESMKINEQPFMAAGTNFEQAQKTSPYWLVNGSWPTTPESVIIGQDVAD
jgi:putative ABC transport system permease protein